ncbi:MAG: TonB-dependent receptor [Pseudomonadales bacterium]|nr:TonB-dependent receptor [Pseudomonadales bacterium]
MKRFIVLTFSLLSIQTTFSSNLEEVIVNAAIIPEQSARLPIAIDKLDREHITRARAQLGLDESLNSIPGLVMQNRYNFAQDLRISIRGFGARAAFGIRGVKIIVDGIPTTLADGQGSIDSIDIGSIGNIEVIKGASSSLYGNASGGVISINTDFDNQSPHISTRDAWGSDGYHKNQLNFNGSLKKLDFTTSLSDLSIDGYRQHSEHKSRLFNSKLRYRFNDDSTLKVSLNAVDQPISNDPGGVNISTLKTDRRLAREQNLLLNAGEAIQQQRLGLIYETSLNQNTQLMLRNYHLWRDFAGYIPLTTNGVIDLERYYAGLGARITQSLTLARNKQLTWVIGADVNKQEDYRQRFANNDGVKGTRVLNQDEHVSTEAIYMQANLSINPQWLVIGGVRYDAVTFDVNDRLNSNSSKRTLEELSPMIGSSYALNDDIRIYANLSSSFETPTTTELAPTLALGTGLNMNLKPQTATSHEIGLKGLINNKHQYDIAIFTINIDDEIIGLEDINGLDVFVNAGESKRKGAELSVNFQLSKSLRADIAYSYADYRFNKFTDDNGNDHSGKPAPGIPQETLFIGLNYNNDNGFFANLDALYTDKFSLRNDKSVIANSSLVSNLRLGYTLNKYDWIIEPFLAITNLGNEAYLSNARTNAWGGRYYESAPDRGVYAGVSIRHNLNSE